MRSGTLAALSSIAGPVHRRRWRDLDDGARLAAFEARDRAHDAVVAARNVYGAACATARYQH